MNTEKDLESELKMIIQASPKLWESLRVTAELNLPNWYICAGGTARRFWNQII